MGGGAWSNDQPRDLIVPAGAGPNDPRIVIGPDIPAILKAQYLDAVAWIGEYTDASHYHYEIWMTNGPSQFQATGWVDTTLVGNEVHELEFNQLFGATHEVRTTYGLQVPTAFDYWNSVLNFGRKTGIAGQVRDIQWDSTSLPHGIVDAVNVSTIAVIAGPTAGTTELDIPDLALTLDNLEPNRVILLTASVFLSLSVNTDQWQMRFRKTTPVTGAEVGESDAIGGGIATIQVPYFTGATPPASQTIFVSMQRRAGTGTVTASGSPGAGIVRTYAMARDISSDTPWRTV